MAEIMPANNQQERERGVLNMNSLPMSIRYLCGCLASSMIGTMLVLFFATLIRSRPERWENSTAYTRPSCIHDSDNIIPQSIVTRTGLDIISSNNIIICKDNLPE